MPLNENFDDDDVESTMLFGESPHGRRSFQYTERNAQYKDSVSPMCRTGRCLFVPVFSCLGVHWFMKQQLTPSLSLWPAYGPLGNSTIGGSEDRVKPSNKASSSLNFIYDFLFTFYFYVSVLASLLQGSSRHSGGRFNCTPSSFGIGTSSFGGVTFATCGFVAFLSVARQRIVVFGALVALCIPSLSPFDAADCLPSFFVVVEDDLSLSFALSPN